MTTTETIDALLDKLDEDPSDVALRGVISDALEESGDEEGLRTWRLVTEIRIGWLSENHNEPRGYPGCRFTLTDQPGLRRVFREQKADRLYELWWKTRADAERALLRAWRKMREERG